MSDVPAYPKRHQGRCEVQGCTNTRGKLQQPCHLHGVIRSVCNCPAPFTLFHFPRKSIVHRPLWIAAANKNKEWEPGRFSFICSEHFRDGKPSSSDPVPTLNLGSSPSTETVPTQSQGAQQKQKKIRIVAKQPESLGQPERQEIISCSQMSTSEELTEQGPVFDNLLYLDYLGNHIPACEKPMAAICDFETSVNSVPASPELVPVCTTPTQHPERVDISSISNPITRRRLIYESSHCSSLAKSAEKFDSNSFKSFPESPRKKKMDTINCIFKAGKAVLFTDKNVKYYLGLPTVGLFELLYRNCEPKAKRMRHWRGPVKTARSWDRRHKFMQSPYKKFGRKCSLSRKQELMLTLMKLRLGLDNLMLSHLFGISEPTVSYLFHSWVKLLADVVGALIRVPTTQQIRANIPTPFKGICEAQCTVKGIVDCTEVKIDTPKDLKLQALTWSDYKQANTIKIMVCITPRGRFSFVSDAWGGRASDKHVILNSGFMDLVDPCDVYLADRGFPVNTQFMERFAKLIVPPRAGVNRLSMTEKEVRDTGRIAHLRIHVERAIGRLKVFRILKGPIKIQLLPLIDSIVRACCGLCNLQKPLVYPEKAVPAQVCRVDDQNEE